MKYTKKQIMTGLKHWQKMLKESNGFCDKLDEIVANEDKTYALYVDGDHHGDFSTLSDVSQFLNSSLEKYINDRLTKQIEEDPEKYDITYNDDSDYDPEYGYGPYGEYDQKEIDDLAESMTYDIIESINDSIDNVNDFNASTCNSLNDYAIANELETGDDYVCLVSIDDENIGIIEIDICNKS